MTTIEIDGQTVPFTQGQSILAAAVEDGCRAIPHLCFDPRLPSVGSCRLCLVRVNGRLAPACATTAVDGQRVESATAELLEFRRDMLRLLFVEGNHFCPSCEASGDCNLQALARSHGMLTLEYQQQYPIRELDATHPEVMLERDRCIFCGLCVRASRLLDGKSVFELGGRGATTRLFVNSQSGRLRDSKIEAGDEAVAICPTGALSRKSRAFKTPIGQRLYDRQKANT
jgi:[NiFe] hydrogenase diaphorase moiety small subunit